MRLIDADKLEELCDIMAEKCGGSEESIWNQFRTTVELSPTADVVERKKGKWIQQDHNKSNGFVTTSVYYFPKCSECGHSGENSFAFCPYCGARMVEEEE